MDKIPTASQFSFLKGIWFVFRDGDREIAYHTNLGLERVFINGRLIFKNKRIPIEIGNTNKHQFTFEGDLYEILLFLLPTEQKELECSLIKDELIVGKFKAYYLHDRTLLTIIKQFFIGLLCLLIMVLCAGTAIILKIHSQIFFSINAVAGFMISIPWIAAQRYKLIVDKINV